MYLRRLRLKNIRGLASLDLNFSSEANPQPLSLLIGRNGTRKSTILRSIAVALAGVPGANALLTERLAKQFVTIGQSEGSIELDLVDPDGRPITVAKTISSLPRDAQSVHEIEEPPWIPFLVGFGAA